MSEKRIEGVIFDLDGVIVSTDDCHYQAWKRIADEEGIPFTKTDNERLRGVSRMESLAIVLEKATRHYSQPEQEELATRKNHYYVELIGDLDKTSLLPGAEKAIRWLKEKGIKIAIGSSSRNAPLILAQIQLSDAFDAIADGNQISQSKPNPEVFLLAANTMGIAPEHCLVVEDADAGIEAAIAGGMHSLGVGFAAHNIKADYQAEGLDKVDFEMILNR